MREDANTYHKFNVRLVYILSGLKKQKAKRILYLIIRSLSRTPLILFFFRFRETSIGSR